MPRLVARLPENGDAAKAKIGEAGAPVVLIRRAEG